jgi:soluble lytic murein transglycosylase-like protein
MRISHLLVALSIAMIGSHACADIYGYIDAEGVAHFSTEKIDERYQLFMLDNGSFDSAELAQSTPATGKTPLFSHLSQHPNLKKYEPLLNDAAREFQLDPALLKAVMAAESGFNPAAVSPKGAVGLMQIMPATAERYGLQADRKKTVQQKLADPYTNIRLAARYLRDLHKLFPSKPDLVIASYNAGEGAVQRYRNTIPPYPETRNYVQIVTEFYRLYKPTAQRIGVAAASDSAAKRIRMTIPARRNMPATTFE